MLRIIVRRLPLLLLQERNNLDRTSPSHPFLRLIWGVFLIVLLLQLHRDVHGTCMLQLRFSTVNVQDSRMNVRVIG